MVRACEVDKLSLIKNLGDQLDIFKELCPQFVCEDIVLFITKLIGFVQSCDSDALESCIVIPHINGNCIVPNFLNGHDNCTALALQYNIQKNIGTPISIQHKNYLLLGYSSTAKKDDLPMVYSMKQCNSIFSYEMKEPLLLPLAVGMLYPVKIIFQEENVVLGCILGAIQCRISGTTGTQEIGQTLNRTRISEVSMQGSLSVEVKVVPN